MQRLMMIVICWLGLTMSSALANGEPENPFLDSIHYATLEEAQQWVTQTQYDIHETDRYGGSVVHRAARRNSNPAVTEFLLMQGFEVDIRDKDGYTPLMWTGGGGNNPAMIDLLIKHGADIHARNKRGETALMYAAGRALHQHRAEVIIPMIERLLFHGADIFAEDNEGKTAWEYANGPVDVDEDYWIYRSGQQVDPFRERKLVIDYLKAEIAKREQ